ncbi:MAG: uroporphyrinogen decarboxylase/cobalamine-independent methonine synthase family protein [Armatimonadota bacterium]
MNEPTWSAAETDRKREDLSPAWHAWAHSLAFDQFDYMAEAMPGHHVVWGSLLTTLPVLAGGDYGYMNDTAWMKPMPDVFERPVPRFDPNNPTFRQLDACYAAIQRSVGDRGFITPPLMMDGLTTLSEFRTQAQLCLDLLERPHDVCTWAAALNTMYIDIYEYVYQRYGTGRSLCFFGPMAEGRSEGVQCDFAVMISPAMFEEFVLPDLRRVTDYLDYSLYHLDGVSQMRFLDLLQQCPKLNGIQWNPEHDMGYPSCFYPELREIRRRGLCLFVGCASVEEAAGLTHELGPDGLYLALPPFETHEEADAAIAYIAGIHCK